MSQNYVSLENTLDQWRSGSSKHDGNWQKTATAFPGKNLRFAPIPKTKNANTSAGIDQRRHLCSRRSLHKKQTIPG